MKTVILRGPVLTQSGYGVHARQIAKWLLSRPDVNLKIMALPWGDTPWIINGSSHDNFIDELMKRTVKPDHKGDVSVQLQLPNEWDTSIAPINVGITAGVETDRCHPDWVKACNSMNAVVVPSTHVKSTFLSTGDVTCPIHVIPEAYSEALGKEPTTTLPDFDTSFNFLIFGQLTSNNPEGDRKNIFYTIKWLCETFKDDPDVGIIVKTNSGRNSLIDKNVTHNMLSNVVKESRRGAAFPKVYLLHGDMSDEEVNALYQHRQVKALVALTRGEGYGLPILEAAASGLPIIATNWSGHLDFLKHGKFISIYYKLAEVHQSRIDGKIFVPGSRWAYPSEDDFKKRVTKFRNSSTVPRQWALELKQKVIENYGISRIIDTYNDTLKDLL